MNSHLRAMLTLPVVALIVIPGLIAWSTGSVRIGLGLSFPLGILPVVAGLVLAASGLSLLGMTIRHFARSGEGTLAPWDPTRKLVVEGIYRHVRNPMHTGVFLVMYGEAVVLGSVPLAVYATAFVVLHLFYIPLSEERGLEARFGEEYREYRRHVPRWIPRLTPWLEE